MSSKSICEMGWGYTPLAIAASRHLWFVMCGGCGKPVDRQTDNREHCRSIIPSREHIRPWRLRVDTCLPLSIDDRHGPPQVTPDACRSRRYVWASRMTMPKVTSASPQALQLTIGCVSELQMSCRMRLAASDMHRPVDCRGTGQTILCGRSGGCSSGIAANASR